MDKVRVYCDAFAKTLTVWLADPSIGRVYEEADDNTVFTKDVRGVDAILQKANLASDYSTKTHREGWHDNSDVKVRSPPSRNTMPMASHRQETSSGRCFQPARSSF